MPKAKQPYLPLYTGDWMKDPAVSLCEPSTRGIWIDLLCAMHEAGREGKLCGTTEQLARMARCTPAQLSSALTDLSDNGAASIESRNGKTVVTNFRMVREYRISQERAKAGKKGGETTQANMQAKVVAKQKQKCEGEVDFKPEPKVQLKEVSTGVKFPAGLDTPEFRAELDAWIAHCASRNKQHDPMSIQAIVAKMNRIGHDRACIALEHSRSEGWVTINEPKPEKANGQKSRTSHADYNPEAKTVRL